MRQRKGAARLHEGVERGELLREELGLQRRRDGQAVLDAALHERELYPVVHHEDPLAVVRVGVEEREALGLRQAACRRRAPASKKTEALYRLCEDRFCGAPMTPTGWSSNSLRFSSTSPGV